MKTSFILLITGAVLMAGVANGAEWYAATNGSGTDGLSWTTAWTNIQDAINAASDGDTIYLAAHTFRPPRSSPLGLIVWTNKGLSLFGGYAGAGSPGPLTNSTTIIYNPYAASGSDSLHTSNRVLFVSAVTNGTLAGITIRNGYIGHNNPQNTIPFNLAGAGIFIENSTNIAIRDCIIEGNCVYGQQNSQVFGGGIFATNSFGSLSNVVARSNWLQRFYGTATYGSGIYLFGGMWVLTDCVIRDNTTGSSIYGDTTRGIGLYVNGGIHSAHNLLCSRNFANPISPSAPQGDAIYVADGTVTVENATIYWHWREGVRRAGGTLTLKDSIIWDCGDDVAGTGVQLRYCDIQDGDSNGVAGCFSADPLFERGFYLAPSSPCVNAGSRSSSDAGLSSHTTSASGEPDAGTVDIGYHFKSGVTDYYVSASGSDGNAGTNAAAPLRTIGRALSLITDGSHIHLGSGIYTTNHEVFPLLVEHKSGIKILGEGAATTIIDAANANGVLQVKWTYPDSGISGVTLRRGRIKAGGAAGAGLYLTHFRGIAADLVIVDNALPDPATWGELAGAGLYGAWCDAVASNCFVAKNTLNSWYPQSSCAAGVYAFHFGGLVNCVIASNSSYVAGSPPLWNPDIIGGGITLRGSNWMRNCLVFSNSATIGSGSGLAHGSGICINNAGTALFPNAVTIDNCTVVSNGIRGIEFYPTNMTGSFQMRNTISYKHPVDVTSGVAQVTMIRCLVGSAAGPGTNDCIVADPLFMSAEEFDFRLRRNSPCVNAGTNLSWMAGALDLGGRSRIIAGVPDIGAYESPAAGTVFIAR